LTTMITVSKEKDPVESDKVCFFFFITLKPGVE